MGMAAKREEGVAACASEAWFAENAPWEIFCSDGFVYIDEPLAMVRGGVTHYYLTGSNYNVEAIADAAGNLVERYEVDPYGAFVVWTPGADLNFGTSDDVAGAASTVGNEFVFQGRSWDAESGLYHFRWRQMSPEMGRFVSRDPMRFDGGDVNLYRFEGNAPQLIMSIKLA